MIKMIIVDDEYIILDSLKTLIDWASIGVEVAGTADNGAAAIDLTLKQKPDIILSDISMPYFSGLEMLETIRRHDLSVEVIFITAYSKFEYAREAIRFGVFDYILKPINEELLLQTVSRCAAKIRAEREQRQLTEGISLDAARRRDELLLRCLVQGRVPSAPEWEEIRRAGPDPETYPLGVLIGIRHGEDTASPFDSAAFPPQCCCFPLHTPTETLILACLGHDAEETGAEPERRKLIPALSAKLKGDTVVAISETGTLSSCFERAYAEVSFTLIAAQMSRKKPDAAGDKPLFFADIRKAGILRFPGFDKICGSIDRNIRNGKKEDIRELLYTFFLGFLEKGIFYDLDLTELYCIELIDHVLREEDDSLRRVHTPASWGGTKGMYPESNTLREQHTPSACGGVVDYINPEGLNTIAIKKNITACTSLDQLFTAAGDILEKFCRQIAESQTPGKTRFVRQTLKFIHEHYGENISLPQAAEQLYISPNYLSRIFSAEMEESFSRYLLNYRTGQAKKLLRETYDKVYEIAAKVGYADVVHFSKVFKQVTGLSPNQYRNGTIETET
jgi:two-component system response regulator YesN